nr:unnamed protein product [Naegleria fowleri]
MLRYEKKSITADDTIFHQPTYSPLQKQLNQLFLSNKEVNAKLTFSSQSESERREIPIHTNIVNLKTDWFAAALDRWSEDGKECSMYDESYDLMLRCIRFIYIGTIYLENEVHLPMSDLVAICSLADKYFIEGLYEHVEQHVMEVMNVDNVIEACKYLVMHSMEEDNKRGKLYKFCQEFLQHNHTLINVNSLPNDEGTACLLKFMWNNSRR